MLDGAVVIVDQTALPDEVRHLTITDVDDLVDACGGWPCGARRP